MVCWDMRFQLPINTILHPRNARVRRIACHPLQPNWVVASFQGNNEVSMWDLETSAKKKTLWASQYPPLSNTQVSHDSILAMHASHQQGGKAFFITAGTDKRIRHRDLRDTSQSAIVAGASTDNLDIIELKYNNRLIDGTEIIYESYEKRRNDFNSYTEERPRRNEAPTGHHDSVVDIMTTTSPQNFLISASMDGVIKVWK